MRIAAALVLFGVITGTTGVFAQSSNDNTVCFSIGTDNFKDPDFIPRGIAACTRQIGKSSGKALAAIYGARGYWKTKQDKLDDALVDFEKAISINPANVELYDYRADVYLAKGNLQQALASYKMSIRVDPKYAAAYYGAGQVHEKLGQVDLARESYHSTLAAPTQNRIGEWAHRQARARLEELDKKK